VLVAGGPRLDRCNDDPDEFEIDPLLIRSGEDLFHGVVGGLIVRVKPEAEVRPGRGEVLIVDRRE
jgi:hypothetical protein